MNVFDILRTKLFDIDIAMCAHMAAYYSDKITPVQHEQMQYGVCFPPLNSTGWQHSTTLLV